MWTCHNCGEQIEDNFDACWNCGTSIDGTLNPDFCTESEVTGVTAIGTEGPADGDPLQSLIAKILEAEARGEAVDLDALIEATPEHANSLREFIADHDRMKSAARIDSPTLPPRSAEQSREEPTIAPASPVEDLTLASTEPASPDNATAVGDQVRYFGDYKLLEEIARGGMGVVYKARQISLNRIVALKMILAGQFAGEEDVQRFHAEAEAAANLDHPGIVPIFEIGEHEGQHYFSMGYVEGESLAQKVADGPLAATRSGGARQENLRCDGLCPRAWRDPSRPETGEHSARCKRSAEGDRLWTGEEDRSRQQPDRHGPDSWHSRLHAAGASVGQEPMMGPLADVYSLGAILYCLLTGRPPFQAASPIDTLLQVLDREPLSPKELNAAVPTDLETICLKCLRKHSTERYETAGQLGSDLSCYLAGRPIQARPLGRVGRAWKWCKRKPIVATLSAATLILLVAVCLVTTAAYLTVASTLSRLRTSLSQSMNSAEAGPGLRAGAAIALWELDHDPNSVMPTLVECLNSGHTIAEPAFREVAKTLEESKPAQTESVPALVALLLANQDVLENAVMPANTGFFNPSKEFAARALVEIGPPAIEPLLLELKAPDNQDRGWGIRPDQTRMPPLFEAIRELRNTVADPSRIDTALMDCCATYEGRVIQKWATEILGTTEGNSSKGPASSGSPNHQQKSRHWIDNLESDDPYKRAWATNFLAYHPYVMRDSESWRQAISRMAINLNDPEDIVCISSARALWSFTGSTQQGEETDEISRAIVPEVIKAIRQVEKFRQFGSFYERPHLFNLFEILGNIGPEAEEAVPALVELLASTAKPDISVPDRVIRYPIRRYAADAIGRIGHSDSVLPLMKLLDDDYEYADASAVTALGRIGRDAQVAVPKLLELLSDDRASVREAAGNALIKIDLNAVIKFKMQQSEGGGSGELHLEVGQGYKTLLGLPASNGDGDLHLVKVRDGLSIAEEGLSFFGDGLKSLGDIGDADLATIEVTEDNLSRFVKVVKGHTYIARAKSGEEKGHFVVFRVTDVAPDESVTLRYCYR